MKENEMKDLLDKSSSLQKNKEMEEIIKYISMDMLRLGGGQTSYSDDYLFISDRLEDVFQKNRNVKLDMFLMIYCLEGEIKLELNNISHTLHSNDLIVSLPNTLIAQVLTSPNYKAKVICFSNRFVRRMTQTKKYTWKSICYILNQPVKHFEVEESKYFIQYLSLMEHKIQVNMDELQKEILLYIASAFFGEMIAETTRKSVERESHMDVGLVKQPDFIFKQFMEALAADNGKHRTLEYYAEMFCYSPKYLSRIIKQVSGKRALTLIYENAIEHIIMELKYSNKSIKEIAMDFDFSNVSFFAQYVKKHLGMTPSEFRSRDKTNAGEHAGQKKE